MEDEEGRLRRRVAHLSCELEDAQRELRLVTEFRAGVPLSGAASTAVDVSSNAADGPAAAAANETFAAGAITAAGALVTANAVGTESSLLSDSPSEAVVRRLHQLRKLLCKLDPDATVVASWLGGEVGLHDAERVMLLSEVRMHACTVCHLGRFTAQSDLDHILALCMRELAVGSTPAARTASSDLHLLGTPLPPTAHLFCESATLGRGGGLATLRHAPTASWDGASQRMVILEETRMNASTAPGQGRSVNNGKDGESDDERMGVELPGGVLKEGDINTTPPALAGDRLSQYLGEVSSKGIASSSTLEQDAVPASKGAGETLHCSGAPHAGNALQHLTQLSQLLLQLDSLASMDVVRVSDDEFELRSICIGGNVLHDFGMVTATTNVLHIVTVCKHAAGLVVAAKD